MAGFVQFGLRHLFVPNALEFQHQLFQGAVGHGVAHLRVRRPGFTVFIVAHAAVSAVGVAVHFPQIQKQACLRAVPKHLVHHRKRDVVWIRAACTVVPGNNVGLHGVGAVHKVDLGRSRRR